MIDARTHETRVRAVADKDRKGQASEDRDDDADEAEDRASPAPEEAKPAAKKASGTASKSAAKAADDASDDEAGDDEGSEDEEAEAGEEGERDAAAQRVAEALGVEGGEEPLEGAEKAEAEAPAAPPNRAARRQEAAQRRKKRNKPAAAADAEEDLPKDKNARARELLKRRREQASEPRPIDLLPGEMVDDALARSTSAIGKWIRTNFSIIQWVVVGALVAGGGYLLYASQVEKKSASASSALAEGVAADRGMVRAEDKRSDEEKAFDPVKVYKTTEERTEAALAGYRKVLEQHPNTGAAMLARLGEAGAYLDKRDWAKALEGFSAVASSTLAGADPDVKARALEGLGFAKEGKGDVDGAMATYKELQGVDARGFKELGMYHEARMLLLKGDKEKAKDLLKQVKDKLGAPTTEGKIFPQLQAMVDDTLRKLDPSLVPNKAPVIGGAKGNAVSADQMEKIQRMIEDMKKKQPAHDDH